MKETQLKIMMWVFIVIGSACWIIGFLMHNWMTTVCGLALLIGAMGAYTNIRITRIEEKLGTKERAKGD
ncbi:MAG: hypothetical protein QMD21_03950 [Candidatus Thermoplasmatota archaeon]|nr:hypothetical protein [Candidatus Thermoplasmatota archaeon]